MATVTVASIVVKVQTILQDVTGIRWPEAELLGWLNDGQREVVLYKPNAFVTNENLQLVQGTRQDLPASGVQLIDVVRNMGTSGSAPGRAIRITMREILDAQVPDWHNPAITTPSAEVKHYMYSLLDPRHFYVYPPQPASSRGYVELIYGAAPGDATLVGTISLDDIYMTVLIDYIMYRAYSKDTEYAADTGRAAAHQQAYLSALTGKAKVEAIANPNASAPANPNVVPNTR